MPGRGRLPAAPAERGPIGVHTLQRTAPVPDQVFEPAGNMGNPVDDGGAGGGPCFCPYREIDDCLSRRPPKILAQIRNANLSPILSGKLRPLRGKPPMNHLDPSCRKKLRQAALACDGERDFRARIRRVRTTAGDRQGRSEGNGSEPR